MSDESDTVIDLTTMTRKHIQKVAYNLTDINSGLGFQYRYWRYFKPYWLFGYSNLNASVTMDYHESGRQLIKSAHIFHSSLNRGRFNFDEKFWNASLGTKIIFGKIFMLDLEGKLIPVDDTLIASLRAAFNYWL